MQSSFQAGHCLWTESQIVKILVKTYFLTKMDFLSTKLEKLEISVSACASPKPSGRASPKGKRAQLGLTKSSGDQPTYVLGLTLLEKSNSTTRNKIWKTGLKSELCYLLSLSILFCVAKYILIINCFSLTRAGLSPK